MVSSRRSLGMTIGGFAGSGDGRRIGARRSATKLLDGEPMLGTTREIALATRG